MRNLDWYLDTAKSRHTIKSENKLAHELGLTAQSLFQWRQGRAWPKSKHMKKLANLCDVQEQEALIDLMIWSDTESREIWQEIATKIKNIAAVSLVIAGIGAVQADNVYVKDQADQGDHSTNADCLL